MNQRKTALLSGARRGIGRGIACALAEAGFDIIVNDIVEDEAAARTLEMLAERGARARFAASDIADVATHDALLDIVYSEFGRLDCLVNNAGVMCVRGDLLDASPDDFDRVIGVNLKGTFFLTQAAARRMIAEEESRSRTIVTISSANTVMVSPEKSFYCISKSALAMVVQMFGVRLAENGIASSRSAGLHSHRESAPSEKFTAMIEAGATPIRRWARPRTSARQSSALRPAPLPTALASRSMSMAGRWSIGEA